MSNPAYIKALRNKHALLTKQIEFEEKRPSINRGLIVTLKRERLAIKDMLIQDERQGGNLTSFG